LFEGWPRLVRERAATQRGVAGVQRRVRLGAPPWRLRALRFWHGKCTVNEARYKNTNSTSEIAMKIVKLVLFFVFVDFVVFTAWVTANGGSIGEIWAAIGANPWFMQVSIDLVIALSMVCVWMWNDARSRGRNAVPWIVATVFTGSIAPLAYLLFRPTEASEQAAMGVSSSSA
jgi:hypothetical protein